MNLVDFLCALLKFHGETLRIVGAYCDVKEIEAATFRLKLPTDPKWSDMLVTSKESQSSGANGYERIDDTVSEIDLDEELENQLWSFLPYRALIESEHVFDSRLRMDEKTNSPLLLDHVLEYSRKWCETLRIEDPSLIQDIENGRVRFRAEVLKKTGAPRLSAVRST